MYDSIYLKYNSLIIDITNRSSFHTQIFISALLEIDDLSVSLKGTIVKIPFSDMEEKPDPYLRYFNFSNI